jgi:hypothetical protein
MRKLYVICLILAVVCAVLGLIGLTKSGQNALRGATPANETAFQADDRYIGAGLAPVIFGFVPATFLIVFVGIGIMRRKARIQLDPSIVPEN